MFGYLESVNKVWSELPAMKAELDRRTGDLQDRIPIRDRAVLEAIKGIDPDFADEYEVILILEGYEQGGYWMLSEYEKDHRSNTGIRRGRKSKQKEDEVILE